MESCTLNFKVGDNIGAYRLLSECGEGAYGKVFFAESTVTHRRVALKVVYRHGRNCERELRGLGRYQLICPRTELLQIYHVEDCGEHFFYTMDAADNLATGGEYIPDTLANRLQASGRLPAEAVRKMAYELIECLNTLHGKGLLHRDVKPDNILWIDGAAKLGDIGLVATDGATVLAGTPGFLPPEVLAGSRDYEPQDDFYALGKTIYCAVTGNPVEKFPSFPGSRTLGGCGDLVVLYNRLCRGETVTTRPVVEERRRRAVLIAFAAMFVGIGAVAWFCLRSKAVPLQVVPKAPAPTTPPSSAIAVPQPVSAVRMPRKPKFVPAPGDYDLRKLDFMKKYPSIVTTRKTWYENCAVYLGLEDLPEVKEAKQAQPSDKQAARVLELGSLLNEYAVSPEFFDIFRKVIVAANKVEVDWQKMPRNTKAEFRAAELFLEDHERDPEVLFESAMELISYNVEKNLKYSADGHEESFRSYFDDLEKQLADRKKLEAVLLKKYKSEVTASASDKKSE